MWNGMQKRWRLIMMFVRKQTLWRRANIKFTVFVRNRFKGLHSNKRLCFVPYFFATVLYCLSSTSGSSPLTVADVYDSLWRINVSDYRRQNFHSFFFLSQPNANGGRFAWRHHISSQERKGKKILTAHLHRADIVYAAFDLLIVSNVVCRVCVCVCARCIWHAFNFNAICWMLLNLVENLTFQLSLKRKFSPFFCSVLFFHGCSLFVCVLAVDVHHPVIVIARANKQASNHYHFASWIIFQVKKSGV